MSSPQPYNPLDKKNLGISVADALLQQPPSPLPPERFAGAGVYALYYNGEFAPYRSITGTNASPIYVGKAVPGGRRKGGSPRSPAPLFGRLKKHAKSIDDALNLNLADFWCRYLVVDDIWIPLGESLLIERFSPIWNTVVDGFGNNDPGQGRQRQAISDWDVLHPGRNWAKKLKPGALTQEEIKSRVLSALDS